MIAASGNKAQAKKTMMDAGVPTIPGSAEAVTSVKDGLKLADIATYPVMIKASLGGGGKGMRVARTQEAFESAFLTAQSEAKNAFGDDSMYIEHYVEHPKHIEVQILADKFGNVIHLGERDCSIQRNHQKLIEETPCEALTPELREQICEAAVKAARAVNYENAGTCEFLLEPNGKFYFMEMNTRIQVEHPITEWVTGIDLIKEQIRIASGEKLEYSQDDIELSGHSIEVRINAEDPDHKFRPCPGKIESVYLPGGKGVRVDSAVYSGLEIPPYYDSMLAKLSVWAPTRAEAIKKAQTALGEIIITGIKNNVDYQYGILTNKDFVEGNTDIDFIEKHSRK
jgi:acetyl-CoA carboxylase biotin carboxylase subunit